MQGLLSSESHSEEVSHIKSDVREQLTKLQLRHRRWAAVSNASVVSSVLLTVGGLILLWMGSLPSEIDVVLPDIGSGVSSGGQPSEIPPGFMEALSIFEGTVGRIIAGSMVIMGVFLGVARQNLMSLAAGVGGGIFLANVSTVATAIFGAGNTVAETYVDGTAIQPQALSEAVEERNWPEVTRLLDSLPRRDENAWMLQAQAEFKKQNLANSVTIIQQNELSEYFPSQTWLIESQYQASQPDKSYEMTQASRAFYAEKMDLNEMADSAFSTLKGTLPLTIVFGSVAFVLGRNRRTLESWLEPTDKIQETEQERIERLARTNKLPETVGNQPTTALPNTPRSGSSRLHNSTQSRDASAGWVVAGLAMTTATLADSSCDSDPDAGDCGSGGEE